MYLRGHACHQARKIKRLYTDRAEAKYLAFLLTRPWPSTLSLLLSSSPFPLFLFLFLLSSSAILTPKKNITCLSQPRVFTDSDHHGQCAQPAAGSSSALPRQHCAPLRATNPVGVVCGRREPTGTSFCSPWRRICDNGCVCFCILIGPRPRAGILMSGTDPTCSCSGYLVPIGSRAGDQFARSNAPPPANGRYPQQAQWQVPPTPPLSTSPSSAESYADYYAPPGSSSSAQTMHGQPHYGHAPPNGMRAARSHGLDIQMDMKSPTATTSPASFDVLRSTRRGSTTHTPGAPMRVETTTTEHILSAHIGPGFNSNCITIAARKGNILDIVADRWDLEDCACPSFLPLSHSTNHRLTNFTL